MANTAPKIPLPKTVTSIIASKIPGKDIMPSINRIITARTAPLSMAADAPIMLPASAPTVTEHTPTSRAPARRLHDSAQDIAPKLVGP